MEEQAWFEIGIFVAGNWDTAVWIPLRRNETLANEGDDSAVGSLEEFDGVGAVVIYPEFRGACGGEIRLAGLRADRHEKSYASGPSIQSRLMVWYQRWATYWLLACAGPPRRRSHRTNG